MENKASKKRICLALGFVQAEDAITKIIDTKYHSKYEIVQNVRSKEALLDAINKEKYDVILLREDLPGNVDLIDIFKIIRTSAFKTQIIFLMNERQNGDPFFIELFMFDIFDFLILPNIKLDVIFEFLEKPRFFRDIIRFLPIRAERVRNLIIEANKDLKAPLKVDKEGDVDEILDININKKSDSTISQPVEPQVKEVIKYIEKPIIKEIIREVPVPMQNIPGTIAQEPAVAQNNTFNNNIEVNKPENIPTEISSELNEEKMEKPVSIESIQETPSFDEAFESIQDENENNDEVIANNNISSFIDDDDDIEEDDA